MPFLGYPMGIWLGLIGLAAAGRAAMISWKHAEDTAQLIPAQAATLMSFLLFSLGSGAGLLLR